MQNKKKIIDDKKVIIIGVLFIIVGIYVLSYNYLKEKKDKAFETISFELLLRNDDEDDYTENENIDVPDFENGDIIEEDEAVEEVPATDTTEKTYYIGSLEIPKISLKKGFLDINDKNNYVDKNIQVLSSSNYPDVDKGNFIIAGHSGNSHVGYFNNLYQLVIGDIAYVYYNNIKYTYQIVKIYTQPKTGVIGIYRDVNKTTLTLITCTNNDKTTQTVYIAELVEKTEY